MDRLKLFEDMTILYVEDEESLRKRVSLSLELLFHKVIEAPDGEEALNLFHEHNPDVLLLDICIPKINGLALLEEIRKSKRRIPTIVMSAYSDQEYLLKSIDLNVCKYLLKPFARNSFLDAFLACADWMYEWHSEETVKVKDNIFFNIESSTLSVNDKESPLSKKERILFTYLLRHKNHTISYNELEYAVWEEPGEHKEALKSLIKQLRKKLPASMIENFFGVGYKLVVS